MTAPQIVLDQGSTDPCADCGAALGREYISSAGERSHTIDGSCTEPGWKPATPTDCDVCGGPLEMDGLDSWCKYDCTGDSDTNGDEDDEDDDLPDHRHNSAPRCGKCGGPCEMPKDA